MVAPMLMPSSSVTMFVISFSAALESLPTAPDSRIRFPSMMVPMRGNPFGAIRPPTTVTTMGKRILVVLETVLFAVPITITFSLLVVNHRMIGG